MEYTRKRTSGEKSGGTILRERRTFSEKLKDARQRPGWWRKLHHQTESNLACKARRMERRKATHD